MCKKLTSNDKQAQAITGTILYQLKDVPSVLVLLLLRLLALVSSSSRNWNVNVVGLGTCAVTTT